MTGSAPPAHPTPIPPAAPPLLPALVYAFATAVTMWIIGFLAHVPGAEFPTPATGILLIVTQLAGAALLGRAAASPLRAGAAAGLITSLVNLLILGALVAPADPSDRPDRSAALVVITYVAASTVAGAAAARAGAAFLPHSRRARARTPRDWLGRFALVTVCSSFPVILSGAIVTTVEAGLAVRDWPSTYGALMWLYPLARMTGGIYYEHAHRLFGSLVGLTTLAFLLFALFSEPRRWAKLLVLGVFILVCAQGVLGGIRVTSARPTDHAATATPFAPADPVPLDYAQTTDTPASRALALLHAVSAQITFAFLCLTAAVTGRRWRSAPVAPRPKDRFLRFATLALLLTLLIQLTLGAATRHFEHFHAMMTHLGFAAFVAIAGALAGMRTTRYGRDLKPLKLLGVHLFAFISLQILLGFFTMFAVLPTYADAPTRPEPLTARILATVHQAMGAAILAIAAVMLLWVCRLTSAHLRDEHAGVPAPRSA